MAVNEAWFGNAWQDRLIELGGGHDACFAGFANAAYRALTVDEIRRLSPESLLACLRGFWRFAEHSSPDHLACRVFNPVFDEDGWETEGTVIEIAAGEIPFLLNTLRIALAQAGHQVQVQLDLNLPLQRDSDGHILGVGGGQGADARCYQSLIHLELAGRYSNQDLMALQTQVLGALECLQQVVADFPQMAAWCEEAERAFAAAGDAALHEVAEFLGWLRQGHFTFLAAQRVGRHDTLADEQYLGLLTIAGLAVDMVDEVSPAPERGLALAKSRTRSPVQHARYGDVIILTLPGSDELRLYGLYTSRVQQYDPMTIPILRHKLVQVERLSGLFQLSGDGRSFDRLLRNHPRDELLLATEQELLDGLLPLVRQKDKNRLRFVWRFDKAGRFISVFLFIPKAVYSEDLRDRITEFLGARCAAVAITSDEVSVDDAFKRLHVILERAPGAAQDIGTAEVEASILRIAVTWDDELLRSLLDIYPALVANQIFQRYQRCMPDSYKESTRPREAVNDIAMLEQVNHENRLLVEIFPEEGREARLKIYHFREQLPLSEIMPILDSFNLRVLDEQAYCLVDREESAWLHDFQIELPASPSVDREDRLPLLREALLATWEKHCDVDCFNSLVSIMGLGWRDVLIFRTYSAYLKQLGFQFSAESQARVLLGHAAICKGLIELFHLRFDPGLNPEVRESALELTARKLQDQIERLERLDEDRIIKTLRTLMVATMRTNYFMIPARPYLSLKIAARDLREAPQPRPVWEAIVFSPEVMGLHLRFGPVARGGIRWSDRNDDFRTEILGLVKAQQVKNALIVPVGAKGGFILRHVPSDHVTAAVAGIECYKVFLRGLLDITDNVQEGVVIHPPQVICHDGDDPYLVVAADKGTARFSDAANAVASEYGFWLGDAFASGGSHGYDHKQMGITARGAFVSLQRLCRGLGKNPEHDALTVLGIGDMSGDVFGNGLLLSRSIKLVAAFNHMHVFLDPDPDPLSSYQERQRLFALPQSTWADYDRQLLSQGGGIYSRSDRRISLSPEVKALLQTQAEFLSPDELIQALLRAPLDALWNGGIGTYVKGREERHSDVGDKANESVRVDGAELGARIVVEGGNLGMTQRGRIEYSLKGGLCHADFVDNSAGVDCSDHEVNMKIFFQQEIIASRLSLAERDVLLQQWQDNVASVVLRDNQSQTHALAIATFQARARHREYGELCSWLEREAGLDREQEALPPAADWMERWRDQKPLTRPELAVLLAYTKNHLKQSLARVALADEDLLIRELQSAFPAPMREQYGAALQSHPLAGELAATRWATALTEGLGLTAFTRLLRYRGADLPGITRAFAITRELIGLDSLQGLLMAESGQLPDEVLLPQWIALHRFSRRGTGWFLRLGHIPGEVLLNRYRPLHEIIPNLASHLNEQRKAHWDSGRQQLEAQGLPAELASRLAALDQLLPLLEVITLANHVSATFADAAAIYFGLEARLDLTEIQRYLQDLAVSNSWEAEARDQYRQGLLQRLAWLAEKALLAWQRSQESSLEAWLDSWLTRANGAFSAWQRLRQRLGVAELGTYAPYVVVLGELDHLIHTVNEEQRRYH